MPNIRLTLESITPLLMYGADQNEPELRGPSFRGILRYWLRAVLGATYPNPPELYKQETRILGSTEQGSKVTLRLQPSKRMQAASDQWVMPERTSKGWRARYDAFPGGSSFRLTLSTHPLDKSGVLADDSALVKALFLMAHLGGLGKRARRGSGNLRVIEAEGYDNEQMPLDTLAEDRTALRDYLRNMANFVNGSTTVDRRPDFSVFAPNTCVILLGTKTYPTVEKVLENQGDLWSLSGPYHHTGGIFGDARPRRSSAIHMRVAVTRAGYVPQQTIFWSRERDWSDMKSYIKRCTSSDFELIYGDYKGW